MRVFVSYAHVDEVLVAEIGAVLRAGGFDAWWDDRLEPGDDWKAELRQRISACDAFVCLVSADAVESEWCQWELAQAAALSKPLIPILARAGTPLPPAIAHLQYVDASKGLRSLDVARLVGKLGRLKQPYGGDLTGVTDAPAGLPARVRRPLPPNYRTVAQAYLQPLAPGMSLFEMPAASDARYAASSLHIIGIDFGTSTCSVAVQREGAAELIPNDLAETSTPSAVAIGADGAPVVGHRALDSLLARPERGVLEVKRVFGRYLADEIGGRPVLDVDGRAYPPVHLAAFIFEALRRDAEDFLQASVRRAVVTAPAYFDSSEYSSLVRAAELAGLEVVRVVPEPVAACMGVGPSRGDARRILVYDLGGGTFDVSVLRVDGGLFEVLAVNGDTHLGGADFDKMLVDECVRHFRETAALDLGDDPVALMRLREAAERAKIALSTARTATVSVPFIASAGSEVLNFGLDLTRARYNALTHQLVARTIELTRHVLEDAGLTPREIDDVVVVGRATRAPGVLVALEDLFDRHLRTAPDHVVALGASVQGAILAGHPGTRETLLLDSVTHTLRVQLAGGRTTPVVVRNTSIPTRHSVQLEAQRPGQAAMMVRVTAGESSWADRNLALLDITVGLPSASTLSGPATVELRLDLDANSRLDATVTQSKRAEPARAWIGLRKRAAGSVADDTPAAAVSEPDLPVIDAPIRLPPLPEPASPDPASLERWIGGAVADGILKRLGPEAWGPRVFETFRLERELLVDALEEHLMAHLPALRRCLSIRAVAERLREALDAVDAR